MSNMRHYTFDSFQGLPDPGAGPELSSRTKGAMAMTVKEFKALVGELGFGLERTIITEGFLKDTLTIALQKKRLDEKHSIAFCNVDCDLRESAEDVFQFIAPLVQRRPLLYLDAYFAGYGGRIAQGVAGAYWQFLERSGKANYSLPWTFGVRRLSCTGHSPDRCTKNRKQNKCI